MPPATPAPPALAASPVLPHWPGATGRTLISSLHLPGKPECVAAARKFTELVLGMHGIDDDGVASLLVSELVTNSLAHSDSGRPGGTVTVTIAVTASQVLVVVTDAGGAGHPAPRQSAGEDDEDGRGLQLVEQLAAAWGYDGGKDCTSTWFELRPGHTP